MRRNLSVLAAFATLTLLASASGQPADAARGHRTTTTTTTTTTAPASTGTTVVTTTTVPPIDTTTTLAPTTTTTAAPTPTTTAAPTTTTTAAPTTTTTTTTTTTAPAPVTIGPAAPGGTVRSVAAWGSDAGAGTIADPWRSVAKGLKAMSPGDALYLRGGTFVERVDVTVGLATSTTPVLVAAYPGERPVVQGIFWVRSPSWWTFDGVNVTWDGAVDLPSEHMVKLVNGTGWVFRNAEIWGAHSYAGVLVAGTLAGQPSNWTFAGNCVHDTYATNGTNQDHLIYANTGVTAGPGLIEGNVLFGAANGEAVKLGGATATSGGAANVTIRSNTVYDTAQSVLVSWQSHDNVIEKNLLVKVAGNYSNVRGYQLAGAGNVARNNVGFVAKSFFLNDAGYPGVADGGGNLFPVDPQFDRTDTCSGFHAQNPAVAGYGR